MMSQPTDCCMSRPPTKVQAGGMLERNVGENGRLRRKPVQKNVISDRITYFCSRTIMLKRNEKNSTRHHSSRMHGLHGMGTDRARLA